MIMPNLSFLIKVSRPRFWLYLFGPYLIGLAAGAVVKDDVLRFDVMFFAMFFLFPANLLVYGINDIFDFETDRLNPKKSEYEMLVSPESHRSLAIWIILVNLPFILSTYLLTPQSLLSLTGFIFFSVFYSALPIRAKQIPILDSVFNILYVFPAAFSFQMLTGSFPPIQVMFAAGFWTMAMHAYSAIPDIDSDREAGVNTIATLLGKNGTLIFCLSAYIASAALASPHLGIFGIFAAIIFVVMIAVTYFSLKVDAVFAIYKYFPLVNAVVGFALFWNLAWPKLF